MTRPLTACACAAVLWTGPSFAGVGARNWEVGFGLGTARLDPKLTEDGAFYLDVRGGYFMTNRLQLEGQVCAAAAEESGTSEELTSLYLNLVANFRHGASTVPYFLVGIGSTTVTSSVDSGPFRISIEDDGTGYQAGVGSRFFTRPGGGMAIRLELIGQSENAFGERKTHGSVAAGLAWRLGKAP